MEIYEEGYYMKRGMYNIFWGILGQIITICLGIVVPRMVLVSFGSEINGLLNSVTQIYAYFTLIEAGIGSTTLQALYKPTAENDRNAINGVLSATNKYYKKVSIIYFIAVLVFSTIYPLTVKSSLAKSWVFGIIFLNGMGSVINFWVQGKYILFLNAIGKSYINTNLGTASSVLTSISKIVLLLNGCDVLKLQVVYFLISLLKMFFIYFYMKKKYQWININAEPNYTALSQKNSVFVHQLSYLIFNNTDVILITYFLGLKEVSVYSMYLMLFTMLNNLCTQLYTGFSFRLGQIFNTNLTKYTKLHDIYETYYLAFVFWMYTMAYIYVLPFLRLYTSGVQDVNYIDECLAILFFVMNLLSNGRNSSVMVINFAGHFSNTLKQTVTESLINLLVSLVMVNICGIYGVLIGTIAALLYRMIDMIIYSNHVLLKRTAWVTFRRWLFNSMCSIIFIVFAKAIIGNLDSYFTLILSAAFIAVLGGIYFTICNIMMNMKESRIIIKWLKEKRNARYL